MKKKFYFSAELFDRKTDNDLHKIYSLVTTICFFGYDSLEVSRGQGYYSDLAG